MLRLGVFILIIASLGLSGCGRKPSVLEAPANAQTYSYPPLDQQP